MNGGGGDPAAALEAVQEAQRAAAARVRAPAWYHPAVGAILAVLIASFDAPSGVRGGITAVAMCGLAICVTQYQKRTGTWSSGFTVGSGKARRLMIGGVVVIFLALLLGLWLKRGGTEGAMLACGVAVGIFATWLGLAWQRVFLRDAGVAE
jgi:hypothetical protein